MMTEAKHYFAFISHSSEDEKTAIWLRDKLEQYHIPTAVQRSHHVPKSVKPIFIYQTDLTGNRLTEALRKALYDSRFLIVVCSPAAAKSIYVNDEVQHFIDKGWEERIIPFIVSGVPFAEQSGHLTEEECFPPALLNLKHTEKELRGISMNEAETKLGNKMASVVNILATMLGVRFDTLWDRYKKRRIIRNVLVTSITVLLALIGLFVWEYKRPSYEYYVDYVDKWGVPEGVVPLTKEQVSRRMRTFRFKYQRTPLGEPNAWSWRLVNVTSVNSAGYISMRNSMEFSGGTRYPMIDLEYDKSTGDVTYWIICNEIGEPQVRRQLIARNGKTAVITDLKHVNIAHGEFFTGAVFERNDAYTNASNIVRYVYDRNDDGYIVKETYHCNNDYNLSHSAVSDADGIYSRHYVVDSLGRPLRVEYRDKDDKPTSGYMGVAAFTYLYDEFSNVIELGYWGINNQPINNEGGWSKCVRTSDEYGNVSEYRYISKSGAPCMSQTYKYSRARQIFDSKGDLKEIRYYDTIGEPCMKLGMGAKVLRKYDKHGSVIEEAYYDTIGNLWCSEEGCAVLRLQYDNKGRNIGSAYYGVHDEPIINKILGVHKWRLEYSEDKNTKSISSCTYDTLGIPCATSGVWKAVRKHYINKSYIEVANFDVYNNPCTDVSGEHICRMHYDVRGNIDTVAFFGIDSLPCLNTEGVHEWVCTYSDKGRLVEQRYLDTYGRPCLCNDGYSYSIVEEDDRGREVSLTYYDTINNIVPLPKYFQPNDIQYPAYKILTGYDDSDKKTVETYVDSSGLTLLRRLFRYDEYNQLISVQREIHKNGKVTIVAEKISDDNTYILQTFVDHIH